FLSGTPGTPGSNMSTSSSLIPGDRIISVKYSIDGIGWDPERCERLEEYVVTVHDVTTHAYSLSKYIFLRACFAWRTKLNNNVQIRLGSHLRQAVNYLLRIRQEKAKSIADRRREVIILNSDALKHQENGELQFRRTI
ncbi:hypothetical protein INT47_011415, partial [Mucor saturninus]